MLLLLACNDIRFDLGLDDTGKPDETPEETAAEDTGDAVDTDLPPVETGPIFGDTVLVSTTGDFVEWISTGDVNGDGLADVVGSAHENWGGGGIGQSEYSLDLIIPDATGAFSRQVIPLAQVANIPLQTVLGDLDGDGLADLVFGHSTGFGVLFSDGTTLGGLVTYPGSRVSPLDLGDLDGDGDLDLVTLTDDGEALAYLNDGAGGFMKFTHIPEASGTTDDQEYNKLILRDVDGDGALDLLVSDWSYPQDVQVNLGLGNGTFGSAIAGPGPSDVFDLDVADIDNDGAAEIVFVGGSNRLNLAEWDDGFGAIGLADADKQGSRFALGDIDGDGDTDAMLWQYWVTEIFLQDDTLAWATAVDIGWWEFGVVAYRVARLADVNGDGCDDIVAFVHESGLEITPARSEGCDGPTPRPGS